MLLRQLFDRVTSTYTYLLAHKNEAVLIDPVLELVKRDAQLIKELGLNLKFICNTHVHADHVTGSGELKKIFPSAKSVISYVSGAKADIKVKEGNKVDFGDLALKVILTPGYVLLPY